MNSIAPNTMQTYADKFAQAFYYVDQLLCLTLRRNRVAIPCLQLDVIEGNSKSNAWFAERLGPTVKPGHKFEHVLPGTGLKIVFFIDEENQPRMYFAPTGMTATRFAEFAAEANIYLKDTGYVSNHEFDKVQESLNGLTAVAA